MIYTMRKKLYLVLVLGVLLGWVLHGLTTTLIIRHYEDKPVVLGVAHTQKAQIYTVFVYRFSGVPGVVWEFKNGKGVWIRPSLVKTLFVAKYKPKPGYYSYRVVSPSGEQKSGRFYVEKRHSLTHLFATPAFASELHSPKEWYEPEPKKSIDEFDLALPDQEKKGWKRPPILKGGVNPLNKALQVIRRTLKLSPGEYYLIVVEPDKRAYTIHFVVTQDAVMVQGQPYSQSLSNIDES